MKKMALQVLMLLPLAAFAQEQAAPVYHRSDESFIRAYISRYRNGLINLQQDKTILLQFITATLTANGIPGELKSLAIIESYLDHKQVSSAGAAGPWQLMPATARHYGLRTDSLDERFDIYKSTAVAATILKDLFRHYGDWYLVVAAYNAGSGRVDKALKSANSTSYNEIEHLLPRETREHVRKFIGTAYVLSARVPVTPVAKVAGLPDSVKLASQGLTIAWISHGYRMDKIAEYLGLPQAQLSGWNNGFEQQSTASEYCWIALPVDKMPEFLLYKNEILRASLAASMNETP